MKEQCTITLLSLAFGPGLLHALDADHVMAVTGLANSHLERGDWWRLSLRRVIGSIGLGLAVIFGTL